MFTQNIISQESCHFCLLPKHTTKNIQIIWYLKIRSSNIPKFAYQKWDKHIFPTTKTLQNPSNWCTKTYPPKSPEKTKGPRYPSLPGVPWTRPNPNVQSSVKTGRALRKPCKPHWRLRKPVAKHLCGAISLGNFFGLRLQEPEETEEMICGGNASEPKRR